MAIAPPLQGRVRPARPLKSCVILTSGLCKSYRIKDSLSAERSTGGPAQTGKIRRITPATMGPAMKLAWGVPCPLAMALVSASWGATIGMKNVDSAGDARALRGEERVAVQKNILVVDDDRHCRDGLRDSLRGAGHAVETAANCWEAIKKAKERCFEVAIIDLDLPPVVGASMNGWDLVRLFRTHHPGIAVILVGAEEDKQVRAQAAQLEVSEFLEKPISPARLKTIVRAL